MILTKFVLRHALPSDIDEIFLLSRELAIHEKMDIIDQGNPDSLKIHLFGEKAYANCIVAELENHLIGYCLYFYTYSSGLTRPFIYMGDLYVKEEFRKLGVGKALFQELVSFCKLNNIIKLEWTVSSWNHKAMDFYEALGGNIAGDWLSYELKF
ncbi:MAG: GNAT family N-acetyltransferase [Leptospiraceae bacterium]|nr:GNAT family N-acetyltransferase [Leptospiraceae bacterium]